MKLEDILLMENFKKRMSKTQLKISKTINEYGMKGWVDRYLLPS